MQPDNFGVDPEVRDTILHQLNAFVRTDQLLYDYEPLLGLWVCLGRGHLVPITFKFASFYLDYGIYEQTHGLYAKIIERNSKLTSYLSDEGAGLASVFHGNVLVWEES